MFYIGPGQKVKSLSNEYGISEVTIYASIKKYSPIELKYWTSITPDDYAKLQKLLLKFQHENKILKIGYGYIIQKVTNS